MWLTYACNIKEIDSKLFIFTGNRLFITYNNDIMLQNVSNILNLCLTIPPSISLYEFLPPYLNLCTFPSIFALSGLLNLSLQHQFASLEALWLFFYRLWSTVKLIAASTLRRITCPYRCILWLIMNSMIVTVFNFFYNSGF